MTQGTRQGRRAFTILEVMIAVTIFAIISIAVMQVFRTGTSTFKFANRDAVVMQRARYVFDTMERDLQSIFYLDEDGYNQEVADEIEAYQNATLQLENGEISEPDFEGMYGEDGELGNPFETGRLIDLQMFGEDHDVQDYLTFAARVPLEVGEPFSPWGLARIHYSIDGPLLVRTRESVEANPQQVDAVGAIVLEKQTKPQYSIVARGVKEFDLKYGFWFDGQWFESSQWTSNSKKFRNSQELLADYDEEDLRRIGEDGANEGEATQRNPESDSYDGPPAYVRVRLVISDPENPGREYEFARLYRIAIALESWTPNETLEEDERDMELDIRDQDFTPVFPGALRKG